MNNLTILICTHNRADLLERVLASLNAAKRPAIPVQILVAANACTDDTLARMQAYQSQQADEGWLPLRVIDIPTPDKSHTLKVVGPPTLVNAAPKDTELFLRIPFVYCLKNLKSLASSSCPCARMPTPTTGLNNESDFRHHPNVEPACAAA